MHGLFFGSFNPIHIGHLIIASYMADYAELEEVWFVVSPQNPLKNKKNLLDEYQRLELVQLAIEDDPRFKVLDIEFNMPRPSYTINTVLELKQQFPDHHWALIMGADALASLPKWKNYEELQSLCKILAYPRPGFSLDPNSIPNTVTLFEEVPRMEISATFIRKTLRDFKDAQYLLPQKVYQYIKDNNLFQ
jgi:nicotinate-nucleotide adenylyltransferase